MVDIKVRGTYQMCKILFNIKVFKVGRVGSIDWTRNRNLLGDSKKLEHFKIDRNQSRTSQTGIKLVKIDIEPA